MKTIAATAFKAECLRVIRQLGRDGEPVTITRHGQPVALLSRLPAAGKQNSIIGAMEGTVLHYERPFDPVIDPTSDQFP